MKKLLIATALALPLTGLNAIADDASAFDALDALNTAELTDQQLGEVTGAAWWKGKRKGKKGHYCVGCNSSNTAVVTQLNLSLGSIDVTQVNQSAIQQSN